MKRPILFGLSLSMMDLNTFAKPTDEEPTPMAQPASSSLSQPLNPVAEDGAQRTLDQQNSYAEDGYDRTPGSQFVAEGGADRLAERNKHAS